MAWKFRQEGGDTLYCDMAAAYDNLSDAMKERIEGLKAVHSYLPRFMASRQIDEGFPGQQVRALGRESRNSLKSST